MSSTARAMCGPMMTCHPRPRAASTVISPRVRRHLTHTTPCASASSASESPATPSSASSSSSSSRSPIPKEADVVVIGSGIGGLCCAAITARYGFSVLLLESHTIAGGCAHSFDRGGYTFDSGPSFFAGIDASSKSNNALKQIFDLLGEQVACAQYDGWKAYLPEGLFECKADQAAYEAALLKFGGEGAVREFRELSRVMAPLATSAEALSFANFRNDAFAPFTVGRGLPDFLKSGILNGGPFDAMSTLDGPFSYLIDKAKVSNPFLRNMLDLECFVLSGLPANGTISAEMAYMYKERHAGNATLDYPIGGTKAIIDALVRGLEKFGGKIALGRHVQEITIEGGRATGVVLANGERVRAKRCVRRRDDEKAGRMFANHTLFLSSSTHTLSAHAPYLNILSVRGAGAWSAMRACGIRIGRWCLRRRSRRRPWRRAIAAPGWTRSCICTSGSTPQGCPPRMSSGSTTSSSTAGRGAWRPIRTSSTFPYPRA